jgi:hypothetical protein
MNYFENFPKDEICPVCGTGKNEEYFLVPIDGTKDGDKMEATPVHKTCVSGNIVEYLRLCVRDGFSFIYMVSNTRFKYDK